MSTIENAKVTTNSMTKAGTEYFNPYAPTMAVKGTVPLVSVPKNKTVISKRKLLIMGNLITVFVAVAVVCIVQMFVMMKSSEEYYKKNTIIKNTATVQATMKLVEISGDTLTFKNDTQTFVTQLPSESSTHLVEGQSYNVSYGKGSLIYIGSLNQ